MNKIIIKKNKIKYNIIMDTINIYCKKINKSKKTTKYVKKLGKKIYDLTGGFKKYTDENVLRIKNAEELFEYIKTNIKSKTGKTKEKYFVILMGPPASGKTLARKFASKYIHKHLEKNTDTDVENVFNSFIDISIDQFINDGEIINDTNPDSKTGKDRFKEYADKYNALNNQQYETLNKETQKLYFDMKPNFNAVGNIILNLAAYLEMNIFFEILGDSNYIESLAKDVCAYFGYNLLVIYPHVSNKIEHLKRLNARRQEDGRFVAPEYFEKSLVSSETAFDKIKLSLSSLLTSTFKKAILIKFKNDINQPTDYNFKNFEIENYHYFNYDDIKKPDMS